MDSDEAWDRFRDDSYSVRKASISEKLDVIAAAIQEMQTDTKRTAEIVPKIMGDEAALDAANAEAGSDGLAPGMDPGMDMQGDMMGEEIMNEEDGAIPPEGGEAMDPGMAGGMPPMDMPEGGAPPMGGDAMAGAPPMDAGMDDDYISDEEIERILGGSFEEGPEDTAMMEEDTVPAMPAAPMGGGELDSAASNLLSALKQAMHEAVDAGDMERIMMLSQKEQEIMAALGGVANVTLPDTTMGPGPGEMPMEEEIGEDIIEEAPEGEAPETEGGDSDAEGDSADEGEGTGPSDGEEKGEASGEEDDEDSGDGDDDEAEDDDTESTKKSVTETFGDIPDEIALACGPGSGYATEAADGVSDIDTIMKSMEEALFRMPTVLDIMSGNVDTAEMMKSTVDHDIPDDDIFTGTDSFEESCEKSMGDDFMKSDDRIASAMSIFDMKTESGVKNPDSIASAGTAEEALAVTGHQDPDAIASAEPIMELSKSADTAESHRDMSRGHQDPDSIASAGTAEEALSHKGKQDPDSIASADRSVDEEDADCSEGTRSPLSIGKSSESQGREIMSLREMMAFAKSDRPSLLATVNGDMERPDLDTIHKSNTPVVRMGQGVDPLDVIRGDLDRYNLFINRNTY